MFICWSSDVSSTRGTAIKTGEVNWGLFQIADNRIRAECEISFGNKSFMADVMCDGGAQSELTLPGRKIVQLGLEPFLTTISRGRQESFTKIQACPSEVAFHESD